ncbi:hypothetical protein [Candidatus Nitrospira bockiana]
MFRLNGMGRGRAVTIAIVVAWIFALAAAQARGNEPVTIEEIVADPDAFHLHDVLVEGVVGAVRVLDPYFLASGAACYGAYTFVLEDEAGYGHFLLVGVPGICGTPIIRHPEVAEGDKVRVYAGIQVPTRFGEFRPEHGLPPPSPTTGPPPVQAIARSITRIDN